MITLLVLQGPDKGRRFELPEQPTLIGRESRALPLRDQTTSRRHAELRPDPSNNDGWILRDLGSANGTYVNGQRIERQLSLKMGDQIRVGRSLLVVGIQPGMVKTTTANVALMGADAMDSSIINTLPSNDDSLVLAVPEPAAAAMSNLKILYRLSAALGSSFDLAQVLEVVMDLVFEHVKADRGIIILVDREGELVPKVVRVRDETVKGSGFRAQGSGTEKAGDTPASSPSASEPRTLNPEPSQPPPHEPINASRTIIKYVIESGSGVLSSNAMVDPRFSKGKSVQNLGIRSALCVPIKARKLEQRMDDPQPGDEVIGVIYVDSSVRNYTYSTDQLRLLTTIGLQAGMAIQNAKLYVAGLEAERLAAIGETTAALSHSIKNILQALRGGADVVEMGIRRNDLNQLTKGWRVVDRNLEKIFNLTMNLLAYSRPRTPKLELVNPRKVINECLELIAPMANEKGVMAMADIDHDMPAIPIDADGLHQVLMNLLTNALDAVEPQNGIIRVACRYDPAEPSAVLEVIDNGTGIAPEITPHLFQIFHSTKGNRGTGLGLAVARKIVAEHEGTISATSRPGEGTSFTIHLPVLASDASDKANTHAPGLRSS